VIEKVPVGEPVTWCHRMVICAKKDGTPRRTVDFQALNANATRETHHTKSPFHQACSIPAGKKKTVFDCWNGYHSIPLHPDDKHYTTFITPWGRYRYRVAPQGYIASGAGYTRRLDEIVTNVNNLTKCVDDSLLWEDNIEASFFQAVEYLDLCGNNGITLNPKKFQFARDNVDSLRLLKTSPSPIIFMTSAHGLVSSIKFHTHLLHRKHCNHFAIFFSQTHLSFGPTNLMKHSTNQKLSSSMRSKMG